MKTFVPLTISLGALCATGWGISDLRDTVNPPGRPPGLDMHETHASASLLGQFRTSISSWLWVRTDLYLHNGVEMRPLTDFERQQGDRASSSTDNHDGALHDDSAITTVVPRAEHDFRGVFGDIERATRAYKDMRGHDHNDPVTVLPLFRLMTWVDPEFIPGWTTASSVLARDRKGDGVDKALKLLEEGREKNPESVAIHGEIGYLLISRKSDFEGSAVYLERARDLSKGEGKWLTEDDKDALPNVYRWLALGYRERGMLGKMYEILREGVGRLPDDLVLKRMLDAPPTPLRPLKGGESLPATATPESNEEHEEHGHEHHHEHDHD